MSNEYCKGHSGIGGACIMTFHCHECGKEDYAGPSAVLCGECSRNLNRCKVCGMKKKPKPKKIKVRWSKREADIEYNWDDNMMGKANCSWLNDEVFTKAVRAELERRGFDLTTLKFEICKKEII